MQDDKAVALDEVLGLDRRLHLAGDVASPALVAVLFDVGRQRRQLARHTAYALAEAPRQSRWDRLSRNVSGSASAQSHDTTETATM